MDKHYAKLLFSSASSLGHYKKQKFLGPLWSLWWMTRRNIVGMLLSRFNYNRVTVTIVHISVREWLQNWYTPIRQKTTNSHRGRGGNGGTMWELLYFVVRWTKFVARWTIIGVIIHLTVQQNGFGSCRVVQELQFRMSLDGQSLSLIEQTLVL